MGEIAGFAIGWIIGLILWYKYGDRIYGYIHRKQIRKNQVFWDDINKSLKDSIARIQLLRLKIKGTL